MSFKNHAEESTIREEGHWHNTLLRLYVSLHLLLHSIHRSSKVLTTMIRA